MKNDNILRLVYVGPSLRDGLKTGTIFKGGLPHYIEELKEKIPGLADLFITISPADPLALGRARAELENPNSNIAAFNQAVRNWVHKDAQERNRARAKIVDAQFNQERY